MAQRPVFYIVKNHTNFSMVEFKWFSGFGVSQAQKSIRALHSSFLKLHPNYKLLEISTASESYLGKRLSAFNLKVKTTHGIFTVEELFQAGKVFKNYGKCCRFLNYDSKVAKKEIQKINKIDELVGFEIFGERFPLFPITYFYNWIYLKALQQHPYIIKSIKEYNAFTDIYFNPQKSINCQAQACSIYIALLKQHKLEVALHDKNSFCNTVYDLETGKVIV